MCNISWLVFIRFQHIFTILLLIHILKDIILFFHGLAKELVHTRKPSGNTNY